uniref:Guanylate cyclase domain-containing protein n=1 Tax=Pyramimonas obovata TaxID=1411642 RepID=A0A7S0RWD2_9CHLO|mmetsp:Transcript_8137/g.16718  ORF Transcript_8137/g.16718 Transcript_8137/m.16718 type:complete len:787 (+) Transcript_8137:166-2526(+)
MDIPIVLSDLELAGISKMEPAPSGGSIDGHDGPVAVELSMPSGADLTEWLTIPQDFTRERTRWANVWDVSFVGKSQRSFREMQDSFVTKVHNEIQTTVRVVKGDPTLIRWPVLLMILLMVGGSLGILAVARNVERDADRMAQLASAEIRILDRERVADEEQLLSQQLAEIDTALVRSNSLATTVIEQIVSPARTLELLVKRVPGGAAPFVEGNMAHITQDVAAASAWPFATSVQLAPQGIVAAVEPLAGSEARLGRDLLDNCSPFTHDSSLRAGNAVPCPEACGDALSDAFCYPDDRNFWLDIIRSREVAVAGFNGLDMVLANPVFVKQGAHNASFGRASEVNPFCGEHCYNATSGERFWGFAIVVTSNFPVVLSRIYEESALNTLMSTKGLVHRMVFAGTNVTINKSEGAPSDDAYWADARTLGIEGPRDIVKPAGFPDKMFEVYWKPRDGYYTVGAARHMGPVEQTDVAWTIPAIGAYLFLMSFLSCFVVSVVVNRRRHRWLLQSMLPQRALPHIVHGKNFVEAFSNVTIVFSDIVSYTTISAQLSAFEVVDLLNSLYTLYDTLEDAELLGIYKVETIGDAYMCAAGVPEHRDGAESAIAACKFALRMIEVTHQFIKPDGTQIQIRLGIASGPVVAAVIGVKMPRYTLVGDTVNVASRMESNSECMSINISESTYELVKHVPEFTIKPRGEIDIKGKGKMCCFWLSDPEHQVDESVARSTQSNMTYYRNRIASNTYSQGPYMHHGSVDSQTSHSLRSLRSQVSPRSPRSITQAKSKERDFRYYI